MVMHLYILDNHDCFLQVIFVAGDMSPAISFDPTYFGHVRNLSLGDSFEPTKDFGLVVEFGF